MIKNLYLEAIENKNVKEIANLWYCFGIVWYKFPFFRKMTIYYRKL